MVTEADQDHGASSDQRNLWWLRLTGGALGAALLCLIVATTFAPKDAAACIPSANFTRLVYLSGALTLLGGISAFVGVFSAAGLRRWFAICLGTLPVLAVAYLIVSLSAINAMNCPA